MTGAQTMTAGRRTLSNIFWLGLKELASLGRDPVMIALIFYAFSFSIYSVATGVKLKVANASVAVVDEDRSYLSRRVRYALQEPEFQQPEEIDIAAVDGAMDEGRFIFVLDIPPGFERDALAGRAPLVQLNVDATAMSQAGAGAGYLQRIVADEVGKALNAGAESAAPMRLTMRTQFNPNLDPKRFSAIMQLIIAMTMLGVVLVGAAVIREREHGTIEHLLVMPLGAFEVMTAKVWANGAVILVAAALSLHLMVEGVLGVPTAGSNMLFLGGAALYVFAVTSLSILLATIARTMPQFGLLAIPVIVIMNLLSGATTPVEAMPEFFQVVMQASPSTHFISFAQSVLYRGAGPEIVWPDLLAIAGLGVLFFIAALARFRKMLG